MTGFKAVVAFVAFLGGVAPAFGSSANFEVTAQGGVLRKTDDETVRYHVKVEVGKPFALTAQALAFPRGVVKGQPIEPEAAAWKLDGDALKMLAGEAKRDPSMTVIRLEATKAGRTRVRFAGKVLGYVHEFAVDVEVVAPAK